MVQASPDLVARFDELVDALLPGVDRKLVFGSPTCLVDGNMFFGVHRTGLFVRLPPAAGEELLAAGGQPFEPMAGRAMGGFYVLPPGLPDAEHWVRRSYEHAESLPAKQPKPPRRAKH